jgi:hypothetical protein
MRLCVCIECNVLSLPEMKVFLAEVVEKIKRILCLRHFSLRLKLSKAMEQKEAKAPELYIS